MDMKPTSFLTQFVQNKSKLPIVHDNENSTVWRMNDYVVKLIKDKKQMIVSYLIIQHETEVTAKLIEYRDRNSKFDYIVKYYDQFQFDGGQYVVMESCDCDLMSVQGVKWNEGTELVKLIKHVILAFRQLLEIFGSEFMHRDLSIYNILKKGEYYKVCDFGISKIQPNLNHTQGIGTGQFRAPEILTSNEYDNKVDIYSLGVIIYWLQFGEFPNINQLRYPHTFVQAPILKLMYEMLHKDPSDRISWQLLFNHNIVKCNPQEFLNESRLNTAKLSQTILTNLDSTADHSTMYKSEVQICGKFKSNVITINTLLVHLMDLQHITEQQKVVLFIVWSTYLDHKAQTRPKDNNIQQWMRVRREEVKQKQLSFFSVLNAQEYTNILFEPTLQLQYLTQIRQQLGHSKQYTSFNDLCEWYTNLNTQNKSNKCEIY